jgi:uncharacterized membrane protein
VTDVLDLLGELIRFRTVGGGEGTAARHCAGLVEEAGLGTQLLEWEPGREQLVARTADNDGPPLTFTGHLDTVPVRAEDWSVDPWAAERDGDKVVGRGASDMKSGVAAAVVATVEHAARPHTCRGVQLVLTAGEETGCTGLVNLDAAGRDAIAVGGPLVVALCTEFTSLILLRFVEERARGIEPQEAVDVVGQRTGRAFIVSGLTAIAGVAVLSFSSLPLLRDFGRIVAMNVAVALLSALVVLPPMLVWAEKRGWVSRGLIKPVEPFVETPPRPVDPALAD